MMKPTSEQSSVLVTGGSGFIGSNFIERLLASADAAVVVNFDNLSYAANCNTQERFSYDPRYHFVYGDITDRPLLLASLRRHRITQVVHFAAESHVDRSIADSSVFIKTNLCGTYELLEAVRTYLAEGGGGSDFRFLHVSTDEVFGALKPHEPGFTEKSVYRPNSPYSATKAGSDHLVRAWQVTYGVPTVISNCSNNYGPFQHPEKFIPLLIKHCLLDKSIPIYGDGLQVRDWLYVDDHCSALQRVLESGRVGDTYNIGGNAEITNIELANMLCEEMDLACSKPVGSHAKLITYVTDRLGHDRRYAINSTKIQSELNWKPQQSFRDGLKKTIKWYLANHKWLLDK
jgi:dTDP-glucose 4,6-dehydratase